MKHTIQPSKCGWCVCVCANGQYTSNLVIYSADVYSQTMAQISNVSNIINRNQIIWKLTSILHLCEYIHSMTETHKNDGSSWQKEMLYVTHSHH